MITKVCFSDVTKPHRSDDRRYMCSPGLPFLDSETPALFMFVVCWLWSFLFPCTPPFVPVGTANAAQSRVTRRGAWFDLLGVGFLQVSVDDALDWSLHWMVLLQASSTLATAFLTYEASLFFRRGSDMHVCLWNMLTSRRTRPMMMMHLHLHMHCIWCPFMGRCH